MRTSDRLRTLREPAKLALRSVVGRAGLSVGRDPFANRLTRAAAAASITTVLDVGANEGQYAGLLRAAGYAGTLVSYEPVGDAFARLSHRASRDPHWSAVNAGLGAEAGDVQINVSANSYSSSILPITDVHVAVDPTSAYQRTETVRLRTVDEEIDRLGVDPATTLLKIDTQGYEEQALQGASASLPRLAAVQLELSLVEVYTGQSLAGALTARLETAGLTLWTFDPGISDAEGRLLQYDALFVRGQLIQSSPAITD